MRKCLLNRRVCIRRIDSLSLFFVTCSCSRLDRQTDTSMIHDCAPGSCRFSKHALYCVVIRFVMQSCSILVSDTNATHAFLSTVTITLFSSLFQSDFLYESSSVALLHIRVIPYRRELIIHYLVIMSLFIYLLSNDTFCREVKSY